MGFIMEWVKIEVNWLIKRTAQIPNFFELSYHDRIQAIETLPRHNEYDYYNNHSHIHFFNHLSKAQLIKFKWGATLFFCVVFYALCNAILRILKIDHVKKLKWIYVICFSVALVTFLLGKLLHLDFYPFSRLIIGFLQSLIPAVILIIISKFGHIDG